LRGDFLDFFDGGQIAMHGDEIVGIPDDDRLPSLLLPVAGDPRREGGTDSRLKSM
jgi:hypothetical protein